jgi:hypothetical protein
MFLQQELVPLQFGFEEGLRHPFPPRRQLLDPGPQTQALHQRPVQGGQGREFPLPDAIPGIAQQDLDAQEIVAQRLAVLRETPGLGQGRYQRRKLDLQGRCAFVEAFQVGLHLPAKLSTARRERVGSFPSSGVVLPRTGTRIAGSIPPSKTCGAGKSGWPAICLKLPAIPPDTRVGERPHPVAFEDRRLETSAPSSTQPSREPP